MVQKAMLKQFCGHVILGLPQGPLTFLKQMNRLGDRPHIFVHRCPFWLRLLPLATVHISAAHSYSEILLFELCDLATKNAEKTMTLIPCSPEACFFTEKYRKELEASYIIQKDPRSYGGLQ